MKPIIAIVILGLAAVASITTSVIFYRDLTEAKRASKYWEQEYFREGGYSTYLHGQVNSLTNDLEKSLQASQDIGRKYRDLVCNLPNSTDEQLRLNYVIEIDKPHVSIGNPDCKPGAIENRMSFVVDSSELSPDGKLKMVRYAGGEKELHVVGFYLVKDGGYLKDSKHQTQFSGKGIDVWMDNLKWKSNSVIEYKECRIDQNDGSTQCTDKTVNIK